MQNAPEPQQLTVERVIRADDLPVPTPAESQRAQHPVSAAEDFNLDAVILNHVRYVLDLNRGNKLLTARQLSISRSTLYRILAHNLKLTP